MRCQYLCGQTRGGAEALVGLAARSERISSARMPVRDSVSPVAVKRTRRARIARRRARRVAAADNDLNDAQWATLVAAWGGCAYCGASETALQRDCVLPISRGGRYTVTNVVPACRSCNASKCNQEVTSWLRRKGLDEPAFLTAHATVLAGLAEAT